MRAHTQNMSRKGKRILFAAGLIGYVLGLALLVFVNSRADNWAGMVSPLFILGGLGTIFLSLLIRADEDCDEPASVPGQPPVAGSEPESSPNERLTHDSSITS